MPSQPPTHDERLVSPPSPAPLLPRTPSAHAPGRRQTPLEQLQAPPNDEESPKVRQELWPGRKAGTDLLGRLQRVSLAIQSLHLPADGPVDVVLGDLPDFGGRVNMYRVCAAHELLKRECESHR